MVSITDLERTTESSAEISSAMLGRRRKVCPSTRSLWKRHLPHVALSTALRAHIQVTTTMPPVRSDKVKAVRISSDLCTPSARPAVSESSPGDDWIWSALDIARNVAMANDLAHIPSIKGIADVFTRMLKRLHVNWITALCKLGCSFSTGNEKE